MISIYSPKGGVGKTSIAFSLAKDLKLTYATNEISASNIKFGKVVSSKTLKPSSNTIFDFAGFSSENAYEISRQSDLVIIPTICDMNSIAKTLSAIKTLGTKNILVIATNIETQKDFDDIKQVVHHYYPDIDVFRFRRTRLLKNAMEAGVGASSLHANLFGGAMKEYLQILNRCKKALNGEEK